MVVCSCFVVFDQRRAAERYPIAPQLSYGNGDGMPERPDGAFLI